MFASCFSFFRLERDPPATANSGHGAACRMACTLWPPRFSCRNHRRGKPPRRTKVAKLLWRTKPRLEHVLSPVLPSFPLPPSSSLRKPTGRPQHKPRNACMRHVPHRGVCATIWSGASDCSSRPWFLHYPIALSLAPCVPAPLLRANVWLWPLSETGP